MIEPSAAPKGECVSYSSLNLGNNQLNASNVKPVKVMPDHCLSPTAFSMHFEKRLEAKHEEYDVGAIGAAVTRVSIGTSPDTLNGLEMNSSLFLCSRERRAASC